MAKYGTPSPVVHPLWCDPSVCEASAGDPYAQHVSPSRVVPADQYCTTVIELHLASTPRCLLPTTTLTMEVDAGDEGETPQTYRLTLPQARRLHSALANLLTSAPTN